MTTFIQFHLLTAYPPANLNRDDLGRPKTARMGGVDRLRVSSQSLKRTWRTSDVFQEAAAGHIGQRTRRLGQIVHKRLLDGGVNENDALTWAREIARVFGALDDKTTANIAQLAHVSPEERGAVEQLADTLIAEQRAPKAEELELLRATPRAVDIALFGRMLADKTQYNVEAACQVAHAITVHPVVVEDDYFSAVDDLNEAATDMGAAHIGETGFAAGVFYSYVCIDRDRLIDNLQGDTALANRAIRALCEAAVKVAPRGKQNSFGSRAYASYLLAEKGAQQPRSLAVSFLRPVHGQDQASEAVERLRRQREHFDRVYGACADGHAEFNVLDGTGSLAEVLSFLETD